MLIMNSKIKGNGVLYPLKYMHIGSRTGVVYSKQRRSVNNSIDGKFGMVQKE